jgi:uncharacterized protein
MSSFFPFTFRQNHFLLSANRTIFWEETTTLVLSDLHLGKSGHFRKSGIAIPQNIFKEDMQRLLAEIQYFQPKQLVIVGDLFHSSANKENDLFEKWRNDIGHVQIKLVKGNHDILKKEWYQRTGIEVFSEKLAINGFAFMHDIDSCGIPDEYCFSGHIHPGVRLNGTGRQSLQLPCFYFGGEYAVLPAFGKFTGTYPIKPKQGDSIFALVENNILRVM